MPDRPVVVGLDDTVEQRWGPKIAARGIYRDPVRSSHGHFVKAPGLRWLSVLTPIPWAGRVWALPFLTALASSERFYARRGRAPKHGRQAMLQVARWLRGREVVVVADSGFAVIDLLVAVGPHVTFVTRLRRGRRSVRPRAGAETGARRSAPKKGARQPTPANRAADPATAWTPVVVSRWYGQAERTIEVATGTALWCHVGKPAVPLRWALVRTPGSGDAPKAFFCTDQDAAPVV